MGSKTHAYGPLRIPNIFVGKPLFVASQVRDNRQPIHGFSSTSHVVIPTLVDIAIKNMKAVFRLSCLLLSMSLVAKKIGITNMNILL